MHMDESVASVVAVAVGVGFVGRRCHSSDGCWCLRVALNWIAPVRVLAARRCIFFGVYVCVCSHAIKAAILTIRTVKSEYTPNVCARACVRVYGYGC